MRSLRTPDPAIVLGIALALVAVSALWIGQRRTDGGPTCAAPPAMAASSVLGASLMQAGVPTPRSHCETPTPGPWPTSWTVCPDLVVRGMAVDAEPCTTCVRAAEQLGVVVEVGTDAGESPPFVVEVNGRWKAVGKLHRLGDVDVWFPGVPTGETVAIVDPDHLVREFDFDYRNNELRGVLPVPTPKPSVPTCTPAPLPTSLPDLAAGSLAIALQPGWACGTPAVLGLHAEVRNQGFGTCDPFVVLLNGTPRGVEGLGVAAAVEVFAPGYRAQSEQEVVVDPEDQVLESDESNNVRHEMLPLPTLPPCPTVSATATSTGATAAPSPTASLTPAASDSPQPGGRCLLPLVGNLWTGR
jgi:hypothetical protein